MEEIQTHKNLTLEQIGTARPHYLKGRVLQDFKRFFKKRFPEHVKGNIVRDPPYADTWARRFSMCYEWAYADFESRRTLKQVNPKKYFMKVEETGYDEQGRPIFK